jgi:Ca-activated chloride channel family protein
MSHGMVRLAFIVAVVCSVGTVHAANELPSRIGMYPKQGAPLAMLDSKIAVHVRGPIAEAVITQTFRNDSDRVTEATYIFPLPADAAVSAMEIEAGTKTIRASIETREQAQERYERAVAAGVGAGMLEQERPDVFTQTVSAIPAHGTVTVTLRFDTVAHYTSGTWELALPLVVAPRYVPGSATGRPTTGSGRAPDTDRAPDASRVTPGGSPGAGGATEIVIDVEGDDVASPTHELTKTKGGYRIVDPKSDHDAIIRWHAKAPQQGWVEADDGGGYAAVVVEAKPTAKPGHVEFSLVIGRPATVRGDAEAVQQAIVRALKTADATITESTASADLTKQLVRSHEPIVLVTDGLVADDRAVIAAARKVGAPIHVIGIGPAPNRSLLAAIAAASDGTVRFAGVGDDFAALARDVIADVATPPEALAINWGALQASDVVPATLPRLGAGQAAIVLARVKKVTTANARVRGDVFGFVSVTVPKPIDGATTTHGPLARRWAKLELDHLIATGNVKKITDHALRFGLVSPYTTMVAIGDEVIVEGGVKHSVAVPVSVPEGMRWQLVKRETTVAKEAESNLEEKSAKQKKQERDTRSTTQPAPQGRAEGGERAPVLDEEQVTRQNAPVPAAPTVALGDDGADRDYEYVEAISLSGASSARKLRLALALGGAVDVANAEAQPALTLAGRVELRAAGKLFVGVEGALWIAEQLQTRLFSTFNLRFGRTELGFGIGLGTAGGIGPATELTLRRPLTRHLAPYLRYDGAYIDRDGHNTGSFGIEARW